MMHAANAIRTAQQIYGTTLQTEQNIRGLIIAARRGVSALRYLAVKSCRK